MVIALALLLGGCAEPEPIEAASAVELLTRTSLDLRGVRPTIEEIEALEADPDALDGLIDDYVRDERFGARVRELWSEVFLTRTETYDIDVYALPVDPAAALGSIGDEPLRLLQHIAEEDRPYTELVTADYTMANETLAAIWPLDYPAGQTGWQVAHYTDGRPAAGVLAQNGMWWRYTSTDSNANRKRASAVSRILVCHDYLVRPIDFDRNVNLLDEGAVADALRENPACVNCHVSLDPLASYFFGFWTYGNSVWDAATYHPEREPRWRDYTGVEPGWFGEPGYGLSDLGHQIAADHRFPACASEQAYTLLLRRDATVEDDLALAEVRDRFIRDGLTVRALLRAVVDRPEYRAGDVDATGAVPRKMVTPALLASQVEDLTGFVWTTEGRDVLKSDQVGYQTLAGGADGVFVTASATEPGTTIVLVQERLAEGAASFVVAGDFERPASERRLLSEVEPADTPQTDRAAFVAQLQTLHLRLFGARVEADGPEIEANLALWEELHDLRGDPSEAWAGVLTALFRDPEFLFY